MRISQEYLRGRVLDFGCNDGPLLAFCDAENYVGLDIAEAGLERARAKHPGVRFVSAIEPGEKFDTIAALAMIEHVPNPGGLLEQWAGMLAPGGRIVLTTPHPRMEWAHTVGAKLKVFSSEAHDEHEDLLDRPKMAELAAKAGLRILVYKRFLFGANQLFVLAPVKVDADAEPQPAASEKSS
jgi:2-polyprenyl-3-methyl-5-hydroxy-6-metoxy-1,4-benzoquinol methylase